MYNTKYGRMNSNPKYIAAKEAGYRSPIEQKIGDKLKKDGIEFEYEKSTIIYTIPEKDHKYTPDFVLPNGIIVEVKGEFDTADRNKHILVREQNPAFDIRFVFSNSKAKIYKGSKTTCEMWCDKFNFKWANKTIPKEWINE